MKVVEESPDNEWPEAWYMAPDAECVNQKVRLCSVGVALF